MIGVAASESGQSQFLAHGGQGSQIPAGAGEGALRVLAVDAQDGQAVGVKLDLAANDAVVDQETGIERRQGDRDFFLVVVDAHPLERPAADRNIAFGADPLDLHEIAEHVVAGDVILARDRPVGGRAQRAGDAPMGVELELAVGLEIPPEAVVVIRVGRVGIGIGGLAISDERAHLEGTEAGKGAESSLERRQRLGIDAGCYRQVAVGRDPPIIGQRQLQPQRAGKSNIRDECAGYPVAVAADTEDRQQRKVEAEDAEPAAAKADALGVRVLDDLRRDDLPARVLRATGFGHHRARRIDVILEDRQAVGAGRAPGGDAAAAFEHDEQVLDRSVAQGIGQHDAVADQPVPFRRDDDDVALGPDFAALTGPGHLVGGEIIAVALHADAAARGDDLALAVVGDDIGAKLDQAVVGRRRRNAGNGCGSLLRRGRGGKRENQWKRRPANSDGSHAWKYPD